jgi:hypothetical protein
MLLAAVSAFALFVFVWLGCGHRFRSRKNTPARVLAPKSIRTQCVMSESVLGCLLTGCRALGRFFRDQHLQHLSAIRTHSVSLRERWNVVAFRILCVRVLPEGTERQEVLGHTAVFVRLFGTRMCRDASFLKMLC